MDEEPEAVEDTNPKKKSSGYWGRKRPEELSRRAKAREEKRLKAREVTHAKRLYAQGMTKPMIAKELGRSYPTILKWLRGEPDPVAEARKLDAEVDAFQDELVKEAQGAADLVAHEAIDSSLAEDQAIAELAQTQNTPADQYQAYVASQGIKLLRDSIKGIKGPRTIREFSELDQLIRRNLGLNPKGGSSSKASLHIDISLLNNTKAGSNNSVIIDAEEPTDDDA